MTPAGVQAGWEQDAGWLAPEWSLGSCTDRPPCDSQAHKPGNFLLLGGGGVGVGRGACRWPAGSLVPGHRHRMLDCAKAEPHPQEDAGPGVATQQGTEAGISRHSTWVLSLSPPPQLAV